MLTDKQKEAVRLLYLESMNVQDVAARVGVHRTTVWRWSKTKDFKREWQKVRNAHIRQWRKEMGFSKPSRSWSAELHRLEKKAEEEAGKIRDGNTKAFDAAWNAYSKHLLSGIRDMGKRLRIR